MVNKNDYQEAITKIGSILERYTANHNYAAFGLGAIPKQKSIERNLQNLFSLKEVQNKNVLDCFNLNGIHSPEIEGGVSGILKAYEYTLKNYRFLGPTKFSPCIKHAIDYIRDFNFDKTYHIMLILTDGDVGDMQETKDIIIEGCELPLSFIIVGLGKRSFDKMIELDGDDIILRNAQGLATNRDIVQFVKYNDCRDKNEQFIADRVLEEIPEQVVSYLVQNNITLDSKSK